MKKQIIGTFATLLMMTSVSFASPLTDYSLGKVALDVSIRPSGDLSISSGSAEIHRNEKKNNFECGVTVGLGNNFAFQYRNSKADSKTDDSSIFRNKYALTSKEYNILYRINKSLSAFAGVTDIKYASDLNSISNFNFGNSMRSVNVPAGLFFASVFSSLLQKFFLAPEGGDFYPPCRISDPRMRLLGPS